jgi:hypothetical protein
MGFGQLTLQSILVLPSQKSTLFSMKISTFLSLGFCCVFSFAFVSQAVAQSHGVVLPGAFIDGPRSGTGSTASGSGTTHSEASIEVFPTTAKRFLNVRVIGVPSGTYNMGFRRPDGSIVKSWEGIISAESTFVIDIEKVETGILSFYIQVGDQELSASFYHVP